MALRRPDFNDAEQESAYHLIAPEFQPPPKPVPYVSKHNPLAPPTASTFSTQPNLSGSTHSHPNGNRFAEKGTASLRPMVAKTLGPPPDSSKPEPHNPMKKHTRAKPVLSLSEVRQRHPEQLARGTPRPRLKPCLPTETPLYNLKSDKNFITVNAIDAILGVSGNNRGVSGTHPQTDSGMDYLQKPDYGCVPAYLEEIRRGIEKEYDYINQLKRRAGRSRGSVEEAARETQSKSPSNSSSDSTLRLLSEEERLKIVNGLKQQWDTLNKQYQGGTHMTKLDTIGKVRRKEYFESSLAQIEKDLDKLNKRYIYVNSA